MRKRRDVKDDSSSTDELFVEVVSSQEIKINDASIYTYFKLVALKKSESDGSYSLVNKVDICSKLSNSDVGCLTRQDFEILCRHGVACSANQTKGTTGMSKGGGGGMEKASTSDAVIWTIVALLVGVIITVFLARYYMGRKKVNIWFIYYYPVNPVTIRLI